ncbi:MAG: hypothetical protein QOI66_3530 [Myxococcales bacterium]|nr:hypothetical protein [Myxococcales bacterium]
MMRLPPRAARPFSRRRLLASASLAAAALPFAARPRRAHGVTAAPLRLILWPMMNGAEDRFFLPSAGNLAAMSTVTEPLKTYQGQITFLKGINVSGSDNHFAVRSIFSGATIPNYDSPNPSNKSADQIVADAFTAQGLHKLHSLHLGVIPADSYELYQLYGRSTLFFAPKPVDYEANPVTAFDRIFNGGVAPNAMPPPVVPNYGPEVADLLDAEMGEYADRIKSSGAELSKIVQHRDALRAVRPTNTQPMGMAPMMGPKAGSLASVEKLRASLQGNARAAYKQAYYSDIFDAQVDILASAVVSGLTRVATLQSGSADGNQVDPVGPGYPHHNTSHGTQDIFAQCQRWYMTKLARLLQALDVPDPLDSTGKTVLYNSVILVMSECLPISHSSNSVPTMVMGSGGGALNAGRFINANGATNKAVLQTLLKVMGVPMASQFGTQTIAELLK